MIFPEAVEIVIDADDEAAFFCKINCRPDPRDEDIMTATDLQPG
jgi:hypothetical protein